jgi:hypothetical protein
MYVVTMRDCTPEGGRTRGIQITGVRAAVAEIYDAVSEADAGGTAHSERSAAAARGATEHAAARQRNGRDGTEQDGARG